MAKKTTSVQSKNLIKEYKKIVPNYEEASFMPEWKSEGDMFRQLSIYKDYTPVKTSGSTTPFK